VQLYRYFVSQSSEFFRHDPWCCFSTSVYYCKVVFRYQLSPETFGYNLVLQPTKFDLYCLAFDNVCSYCWHVDSASCLSVTKFWSSYWRGFHLYFRLASERKDDHVLYYLLFVCIFNELVFMNVGRKAKLTRRHVFFVSNFCHFSLEAVRILNVWLM
jgi:hypothetical protein